MPLITIQDPSTVSLQLDLSRKTFNKISSSVVKSGTTKTGVKWTYEKGERSDDKQSYTYNCRLERDTPRWVSQIIYTVDGSNPTNPVLRVKSNPTEISLEDFATRKFETKSDDVYTNAFNLLEHILGDRLFTAAEKDRLAKMEMELSDIEVAIPFISPLPKNDILRVIRTIYSTDIALKNGHASVAEALGIKCTIHDPRINDIDTSKPKKKFAIVDNDSQMDAANVSLAVIDGTNHQFTVTFYDKALQMKALGHPISKSDQETWDKYLRMDIRMTRSFLRRYVGTNKLSEWVKIMQDDNFKPILNQILFNRLRICDVLLIETDYNILAARIKKLSPEFFTFWNSNVDITADDRERFGVKKDTYARICKEFNVRPSTGGLVLSMSAKTSMFQNITMHDYIYKTSKQLAEQIALGSNENVLDTLKVNIYHDLERLIMPEEEPETLAA